MQIESHAHAPVVTCSVFECSYNDREQCCAPQIEVGDEHPKCDTFTLAQAPDAIRQTMSEVAACHATQCFFNEQQACEAPGITVTHHTQHADCSSYRVR
ncbi:MAG: DUF1540 domain-containing protein [Coriobacteriia bacterium]